MSFSRSLSLPTFILFHSTSIRINKLGSVASLSMCCYPNIQYANILRSLKFFVYFVWSKNRFGNLNLYRCDLFSNEARMIVTNVHSYWPGMRNYFSFFMFFRCEADIFILFQLFEVQRLQSFKRYKDEPPEDGYICIWHKKNKEEEKLITVPRTSIFSPTWTSLMSFSTSSFFAVVGYHVLHMSFWPLSFLLSTPNYQQHPCFFLNDFGQKMANQSLRVSNGSLQGVISSYLFMVKQQHSRSQPFEQ